MILVVLLHHLDEKLFILISICAYLNLKVYNFVFSSLVFKVIRKSLLFSNFQVDTNDIVVPN